MKLIVVIRDGASVRHERCSVSANQSVLIGRGWHCDIVLQDPEVDAEHAQLRLSENGELLCVDLGSLNGSHLAAGQLSGPQTEPHKIASGARLKLGRSRLDVFRSDHAVGPAVTPSRWDSIRQSLEQPLSTAVLLAALLATSVLSRLSLNVLPLSVEMIVSVATTLTFVCGAWVLFWGLLSKLWRDATHIRAHLSIVAAAGILVYLTAQLGRYIGWQLQSVEVTTFVLTVGHAFLIFAALALTLGVATRLRGKSILRLACVPAMLLIASVYLLPLLSEEKVAWYPETVTSSYPPGWQIAGGESLEEFIADSPSLFERSAEKAIKRAAELAEKAAED